jgi:hypothetical protein
MTDFTQKLKNVFAALLPLISGVFILSLWLFSFFFPEIKIWLFTYVSHSFSEIIISHIIVLVLFSLWGFKRIPFWQANLIYAFLLLSLYLSLSMIKLGDHEYWWFRSQWAFLEKSELIGTLILHLVYVTKNQPEFIAPVAGFFSALAYMVLARNVLKENLDVAALAYLASTIHIVFFRDFIEHTLVSVPFNLLFAHYLVKYYKQTDNELRNILLAAFFITFASLVHGMNTFISPAILIVIFLKRSTDLKLALKQSAYSLLLMVGIVTVFVITVLLFGFRIFPGNIYGGGDWQRFVPLFELTGFSKYLLFSAGNFSKVGNIFILVSPLFLLAPIFFIWATLKKEFFPAFLQYLPLTIISLGYAAFIFLWDFDLGWPNDHDLMVTMGFPFILLFSVFLMDFFRNFRYVLPILQFIAIGISWYMISGFIRI